MGWVIRYIFVSLGTLPTDIDAARAMFEGYVGSDFLGSLFFFFIAFILTILVVSRGIKSGIEKLNVYAMPTLFIMLIFMLVYAATYSGFGGAFKFLFYPDFSKITFESVLIALGLSFFTLCLGVGCILTYAASLDDKTNPVTSSFYIVIINIVIGLMMGLIVFTFIFEFGGNPQEQGVGLVFFSLITLFSNLGIMGNILAFLFFVTLFFAGITSAVSMIEPFTFYLVNQYNFSRAKALSILGSVVFVLGTLCIMSININFSEVLTFGGKSFFDILDYASSNIGLPVGAIISAIFVGFALPKERVKGFFMPFMKSKKLFEIWYFMLKFVAPIAIVVIMVNQIWG